MRTKPPPLLLGACLLFWGWQSDFFLPAAAMAVALEGSRVVTARWEFSDEDFSRIWTFCTLLLLASVVYAFTLNDGPANFRNFLENPTPVAQRNTGTSTARTAASIIRWLPMTFFVFIAAQQYSSRGGVPLETISLILRVRWKRARKLGLPRPATRIANIGFFYFSLCLFAASIHSAEDNTFFWGVAILLAWALWSLRSKRFPVLLWGGSLVAAVAVGYFAQVGIGRLQRYVETFNPQWFSRYGRGRVDPRESRTALGQIGRVKTSPRIMIRLEVPERDSPPAYLREASYASYKWGSWQADDALKYESVNESTNTGSWVLLPGKTNRHSVQIACYLPGGKNALLPVPHGSGQLDNLPAFGLKKNDFGDLLAEGPGLVIFDARYGPGATIDSRPNSDDLEVPYRERPAVDDVSTELRLSELAPAEALSAVSRWFAEKFSYSTWQDPSGTNETALSRFLRQTRSGHCEYFATATVLLLRKAQIPARYAVGYAVHERSADRTFVVRQRDAHAWCLYWDEAAHLWRDFDTTPASWVQAEEMRASPLQWLSDLWSRIVFEFSRLRWGQTRIREYVLWGLVPILLFLLYQIVFRTRRRRDPRKRDLQPTAPWPGLDSEFFELEKVLVARGLERQPSQPLADWLGKAIADPGLAGIKDPLQQLLRLHYRYRFDPAGLPAADREALRGHARLCLEKVVPRRGRWIFPRDNQAV
jgi:protein-glutamine gamma-glutamyltransferase